MARICHENICKFLILLGAMLSGCVATGPTPTITVTPSPGSPSLLSSTSPANTPQPFFTQLPALQPVIEDGITVETADRLRLVGTFYAPARTQIPLPGVLLLHMLGGDRGDWHEFALKLALKGYTVFSVDMRGHGDSPGKRDFKKSEDDLQRVWDYFTGRPEVDRDSTAIIGASIGSNMALITAARQPAIKTVVLLSPGLEYRGITTEDAIVAYGQRPILIVASQEDAYSASSSQRLEELALGESRLILYEGARHGMQMLVSEPELADIIFDWLEQYI
jgi:pimeloyl-ACP methyl ester carboxylesterase